MEQRFEVPKNIKQQKSLAETDPYELKGGMDMSELNPEKKKEISRKLYEMVDIHAQKLASALSLLKEIEGRPPLEPLHFGELRENVHSNDESLSKAFDDYVTQLRTLGGDADSRGRHL